MLVQGRCACQVLPQGVFLWGKMTLADYVIKVMEEKGLNAKDVERSSNGGISDSYVLAIRSGKSRRPSAPSLRGLAKGLGVNYEELVEIAGGVESEGGWTVERLRDAIDKMIDSEDVGEVVRIVTGKPREEVKRVLKYLKKQGR
jgi:transcriptional regulator with XRE-family HTH domain